MPLALDSRLSLSTATARPATRQTLVIIGATAVVALCAHVSFPLPFTPVPVTLQNFAVILLGMLLGPAAGFAAMSLYLAEGLAGMPVFSPVGPGGALQLFGPTGGFLLSYPLVAAAAGFAARRLRPFTSAFTAALVAGLLATVLLFTLGAGWLAHSHHLSSTVAWSLAVAPFLPGEAAKLLTIATSFAAIRSFSRRI